MFNCKWQYLNSKWKLIDSGGCTDKCQKPNILPEPVFPVYTSCVTSEPKITFRTEKSLWQVMHEPAHDFDTGSGIIHFDEKYYWHYVSGTCTNAQYAMPNIDPKNYFDNGLDTVYTKCFKPA